MASLSSVAAVCTGRAAARCESPDDERALLWVLNLSDGRASLLDIAARSGLPYAVILRAAERLEQAGLVRRGRALVIGPRPISLRDDPRLRRRPLDAEGRVIPAHTARRLGDVQKPTVLPHCLCGSRNTQIGAVVRRAHARRTGCQQVGRERWEPAVRRGVRATLK